MLNLIEAPDVGGSERGVVMNATVIRSALMGLGLFLAGCAAPEDWAPLGAARIPQVKPTNTPVDPSQKKDAPNEIVLQPVAPSVTEALSQPTEIGPQTPGVILDGLSINGDTVVWRAYSNNETSIVAHNLRTGQTRHISRSTIAKSNLKVSGQHVVWQEYAVSDERTLTTLRHYDLVSEQEREIGPEEIHRRDPDISGDVVLWTDGRNTNNTDISDIYGYDLQSQTELPIAVGPNLELYPQISGEWVIYLSWPADAKLTGRMPDVPSLRAHHLKTGEDIELGQALSPGNASLCGCHTISGNLVVWAGGDAQLHLYNLETRQTQVILPSLLGIAGFRLHGEILQQGGRLYNVTTGNSVDLFQRVGATEQLNVTSVATDGNTVVWVVRSDASIPGDHDHAYTAQLLKHP